MTPSTTVFPAVADNRLGPVLQQRLLDLVPGARTAVLASADGLLLARAGFTGPEAQATAERLAALSGGRLAIGTQLGEALRTNTPTDADADTAGGGDKRVWRQGLDEFADGWVLTRRGGANSALVVAADPSTNLQILSTTVTDLLTHLQEALSTPGRDEPARPARAEHDAATSPRGGQG